VHRWSPAAKRLLLGLMLLPVPLMLAAFGVMGAQWEEPADSAFAAFGVLYFCGFVLAWGTAIACLVNALRGRVGPGPGRVWWGVALLLGAMVAGPCYWWLHVRPGPGGPHGLGVLAPAWTWPRGRKAATLLGLLWILAFFVAWAAWIASMAFSGDETLSGALPMFAAMGVTTVVACVVMAVLVLDAAREGGTHAMVWIPLLVFMWALVAPVYWWLYVRPTSRPTALL
jgi:hypothetical protein